MHEQEESQVPLRPIMERRQFGDRDSLLPWIIGGVVFSLLTLALLTVGDKAMSAATFLGGVGVLMGIVVVVLLFLIPLITLFISGKAGLKLMLVMWPTLIVIIAALVVLMANFSIPI